MAQTPQELNPARPKINKNFVRQTAANRPPIDRQKYAMAVVAMATNPKAECRLSAINHAYLEDLAKLGAYGKGKSGVMRRFIEDGIRGALEKHVIAPRDVAQFGDQEGDEDAD